MCSWNRVTIWKSSPHGHSDIQTFTFPDFERQTVYCQTTWSWNWLCCPKKRLKVYNQLFIGSVLIRPHCYCRGLSKPCAWSNYYKKSFIDKIEPFVHCKHWLGLSLNLILIRAISQNLLSLHRKYYKCWIVMQGKFLWSCT